MAGELVNVDSMNNEDQSSSLINETARNFPQRLSTLGIRESFL